MTDKLFDDEELPSVLDGELLPDPGFGSELLKTSPAEAEKEEKPSADASASLFPADPFFSLSPEEQPEVSEPCVSEESGCSRQSASDPLSDAVLFDPAPIFSETGEEASLFDMPEQISEPPEQPTEPNSDEKTDGAKETADAAAPAAPLRRSSREKKARAADKAPRAAREMTPERIRAHRHDEGISIRFGKIRFCAAVILTILLAVLEIFPNFGVDMTVPLGVSRVRGAAALLDIQLLLLIALCIWRSVLVGFRYMFTRRFRAESLLVIGLCLAFGYDVYLCIAEVISPVLVSLPIAVAAVATVWIEQSEHQARYGILHLLSGEGGASVASSSRIGTRRRLSVSRAKRVDGYEEHIHEFSENARLRLALLVSLLLAAAIAFFAAYSRAEGAARSLSAALAALLTVTPYAALLARRLYLARLQEVLLERGTALIGEKAAFSAAGAEVFSIADTEAFSPEEIKIRIVNVFHDYRLDEVLRLITEVYRMIGGPFYPVLEKTGGDTGEALALSLVDVGSDGVIAHSGERIISIGSRDFMDRNNIAFAPGTEADPLLEGERMCLLYCSVDGVIVARFYVEYVLSIAFENLAEQLGRSGVSVEIRTADPNISEAYLERLTCLPRGALTVRRVGCGELKEEWRERSESRFFTLDRPRALLGAWLAFRRYLKVRRAIDVLAVLQTLLGGAVLSLLALGFGSPLIPISLSALYHACALVLLVRCSLGFRHRISAEISDGKEPEREEKGYRREYFNEQD